MDYGIFKYFILYMNKLILCSIIFIVITIILFNIDKVKTNNNNNNKVILVTQYYEPKNKERLIEIKDTLINNNYNNIIDEIHLFVEKDYNLDFLNDISKITIIKTHKRLSYKMVFDYTNNMNNNNIILLANSDIYFNETLKRIHYLNYDNTFYALTIHEIIDGTLSKKNNDWGSQDVWIWKPPINIKKTYNNTDYFDQEDGIILGMGACDHRILKIMEDNGYNIRNVCRKIICIHNHKNDYRNWRTDEISLLYHYRYRLNGIKFLSCE